MNQDPARVREWAEVTVSKMSLPYEESEREIERYLSPDRVTITVIVESVRSFDGAKMFRDERAAERSPDSFNNHSAKS